MSNHPNCYGLYWSGNVTITPFEETGVSKFYAIYTRNFRGKVRCYLVPHDRPISEYKEWEISKTMCIQLLTQRDGHVTSSVGI